MTEHDTRWVIARHEAAHVEVARALGATRIRSRLLDRPNRRGWGGWTEYRFDGPKADEAVIILAGDLVAGKSPDDLKTARKLLRGSGTSVEDAQKEAARLIRLNRAAIEATAARLHRRGRL